MTVRPCHRQVAEAHWPPPVRLSCTCSQELEAWTTDFALPTTVWLGGFFNPQSFLTAIMQSMARKNEWPLDKMCLSVEVTKKNREDVTAPPREGAYVYGLFMEGNWGAIYGSVQSQSHLAGGQTSPWQRQAVCTGVKGQREGGTQRRLTSLQLGAENVLRQVCRRAEHATLGHQPGSALLKMAGLPSLTCGCPLPHVRNWVLQA